MCLLLVTVLNSPTVTIVYYFPMAHMVTAVIIVIVFPVVTMVTSL